MRGERRRGAPPTRRRWRRLRYARRRPGPSTTERRELVVERARHVRRCARDRLTHRAIPFEPVCRFGGREQSPRELRERVGFVLPASGVGEPTKHVARTTEVFLRERNLREQAQ